MEIRTQQQTERRSGLILGFYRILFSTSVHLETEMTQENAAFTLLRKLRLPFQWL